MRRELPLPNFALLALAACSDASLESYRAQVASDTAAELSAAAATKPLAPYYTVRQDTRRCAAPLCGGYWVALAGQPRTRCADGSVAAECYVAELGLPPGVDWEAGDLVYGGLSRVMHAALGTTLGRLDVDAVLAPVILPANTRGEFVLGFDSGVRCVQAPCPSLQFARLNTRGGAMSLDIGFDARDPNAAKALEGAFYAELAAPSPIGTGAVAFGRTGLAFDLAARTLRRRLLVANVYVVKAESPDQPVCVVQEEGNFVAAFQIESRPDGERLAASLSGDVRLLPGLCSAQQVVCATLYEPVFGPIEGSGRECVSASSACAFTVEVIVRAGTEGVASGTWSEGVCPEPSTFVCGDGGLSCDPAHQYCQAVIGGQPDPTTGHAVATYACVEAGTCAPLQVACPCLEAQGPLPGASCDENGPLPPVVTLFAP